MPTVIVLAFSLAIVTPQKKKKICNNKQFSVTPWLRLQPQSLLLSHCMGSREEEDS